MAVTKASLASELNKKIGFNKTESRIIVDSFFEEINNVLANGENVKLASFGNFELRNKNPRIGRNLRTGEAVQIESRRVVTFNAGQKLRNSIKEELGDE
jgi:integration host factor subunit alpha